MNEKRCLVCGGSECPLYAVKRGYSIYRCTACGFAFVHPLPSESSEIYNDTYFSGAEDGFGYVNYDEDKEPMIPVFVSYLRRIKKALGGTGTLLDVGAATGFFVSLANRAGFKASGVELSDFAAAQGRKKGLDIQTGTLSDVKNTFDVITMLDVIEHVPDPKKELSRAGEMVRKGGIIVVNTPDFGSLFARMLGGKWHLMYPPEHLSYFTRQNMKSLLDMAGFEVIEMTTIGKSFTLKYILKTLQKATGLKFFGMLANAFNRGFLAKIALPINLRDNMFVVARKR